MPLNALYVYPKEGEPPFTIKVSKTEFKEGGVIFYDEGFSESKLGFLSLDHVAAIVPEVQEGGRRFEHFPPIRFYVHLRKRDKPVEVLARAFNADQPPRLRFYADVLAGDGVRAIELDHVYVALSEVVAVMPEDGLVSRPRN